MQLWIATLTVPESWNAWNGRFSGRKKCFLLGAWQNSLEFDNHLATLMVPRPVPIFDVSLGHWVSKSGFDLPSNLDWAGHSEIEPTTRVPVCLLTVEQLRSFSGYKRTNVILDLAEAASQIRVDTGRGSSFHRLPSLAAVVLNLISLVASRLRNLRLWSCHCTKVLEP